MLTFHRDARIPLGAAVLAFAVLVSGSGCGKKGPAPPSKSSSFSRASGASSSASDYSKPTLTDEKITKFIDSMKEEHNPLEFIFSKGGAMRSIAEMNARTAEFNAFAQKYGFKDYTEYIDVWGRVTVGTIQIGTSKMMKGLAEGMQTSMRNAEEQLSKPNLTAEQRQMYTEQLASAKKSLADMSKSDKSGLNKTDLALVEKYADQIEAASKKYRSH